MNYRVKKDKKFNFLEKKACAIKSLHEINYFLYNLGKACQIKKLLKK